MRVCRPDTGRSSRWPRETRRVSRRDQRSVSYRQRSVEMRRFARCISHTEWTAAPTTRRTESAALFASMPQSYMYDYLAAVHNRCIRGMLLSSLVRFKPRFAAVIWPQETANEITGWLQKVSHYQVSYLNRTKTVIKAKFFCINFTKKWAHEYNISVLNIVLVT